jgi:rhomboid protease GluP
MHIFFNMYAIRVIGPAIIEFYGLSRMFIIYTVSGAIGFLTTTLVGYWFPYAPLLLRGAGDITVGASASLLGLIGAAMYYGRRSGSRGIAEQVRPWLLYIVVFGFVATFLGIARIDNWAHFGGFAGGYLVSAWLDPLHPERLDHVLGALVCVLVSAAAVVWSVVTLYPEVF